MKLFISHDMAQTIEGYRSIPIIQGSYKINDIPRNCCEHIICSDAFSSVSPELDFIKDISLLLRKNGMLVIKDIDPMTVCRGYYEGSFDSEQLSNSLTTKTRLVSLSDCIRMLHENKLNVDKASISGVSYEIIASRKWTSNRN